MDNKYSNKSEIAESFNKYFWNKCFYMKWYPPNKPKLHYIQNPTPNSMFL